MNKVLLIFDNTDNKALANTSSDSDVAFNHVTTSKVTPTPLAFHPVE
jgi:hypothetical protein